MTRPLIQLPNRRRQITDAATAQAFKFIIPQSTEQPDNGQCANHLNRIAAPFAMRYGRRWARLELKLMIRVGMTLALTRLMKTLLFNMSSIDPLTFAVVTLSLIGAALLACFIPGPAAAAWATAIATVGPDM